MTTLLFRSLFLAGHDPRTFLQHTDGSEWGRWDLNPRHPPSLRFPSTGFLASQRAPEYHHSLLWGLQTRSGLVLGFWSPSSSLARLRPRSVRSTLSPAHVSLKNSRYKCTQGGG